MFGFGATPQLGGGLTAGGGQTGLLMPQGGAQGLLASPAAMPLQSLPASPAAALMQAQTSQINPQMLGAALSLMQQGQPQALPTGSAQQGRPMTGGHLQLAALQSLLPYMAMQQQGVQHG